MLSLKKCKAILENKKKKFYTEKEVELIRAFLYKIAKIDYQIYKNRSHEKSNNLH